MKNDITKLAMLGLLAGVCLSANAPTGGKEIAMSKCSKDTTTNSSCNSKSGCDSNSKNNSSCNNKSSCNSNSNNNSSCNNKSGCDGDTSCSECEDGSDQSADSSLMKIKRKAAAEKVVQAE